MIRCPAVTNVSLFASAISFPASIAAIVGRIPNIPTIAVTRISASDNVELLAEKIRRIPKTIHQHLDLIAGLPYEDLESFGKSFDFVMALKPDALQLGFLKILNGTQMADMAFTGGWKWMETPAYETYF